MSGTNGFYQAPEIEYTKSRVDTSKVLAFPAEFGMEESSHLSNLYLSLLEAENIEILTDISDPEELCNLITEYLSPDVVHRLMNTDLGRGIILGYIWSAIDSENVSNAQKL